MTVSYIEAVNAKTKRHIASWVLLAVFLPMLLFASLHIHPADYSLDETCSECVHHQCGGHLTQQAVSFHACVLCQFLTLHIVAVAVAALTIYNNVLQTRLPSRRSHLCLALNTVVGLRAPPVPSL